MTRPKRLLCGALTVLLCVLGAPYAGAEPTSPPSGQIAVKVDIRHGYTISEVTDGLPVEVVGAVIASRGIYAVVPTVADFDGDGDGDAEDDQKLADEIAARSGVVWAELDQQVVLSDSRFHSWPYGMPGTRGTDPAVFYGQRLSPG